MSSTALQTNERDRMIVAAAGGFTLEILPQPTLNHRAPCPFGLHLKERAPGLRASPLDPRAAFRVELLHHGVVAPEIGQVLEDAAGVLLLKEDAVEDGVVQ